METPGVYRNTDVKTTNKHIQCIYNSRVMYDNGQMSCTFTTKYHLPNSDYRVVLVGDHPALSNWDLRTAPEAYHIGDDYFSATVDIPVETSIAFKWAIVNRYGEVVRWEEVENKYLQTPKFQGGTCHILSLWNVQPIIMQILDSFGFERSVTDLIGVNNAVSVGGDERRFLAHYKKLLCEKPRGCFEMTWQKALFFLAVAIAFIAWLYLAASSGVQDQNCY